MEHLPRALGAEVRAPHRPSGSPSDITEELLGDVKAATPTGELAGAEHQAEMIVYLVGSGSDRLTGQVIPIDGGRTAH